MRSLRPSYTRVTILLATIVSGLTAATPLGAQDRLVVGTTEVGAIGHFGRPLGRVDTYLHAGAFAGGRLAVVAPSIVRDLRTGADISVPGTIAAVDPGRPRVFLEPLFSGVRSFDVATGETRTVWDGPRVVVTVAYAPSADRVVLHVVRPGEAPLTTSLVVIDASTGVVIRTVDGVLPLHPSAFLV